MSHINDMDPGAVVPPVLAMLTFLEQLLVARIHPQIHVMKLTGGNLGYSGHCISVRHKVETVAMRLPISVNRLPILWIRKFWRNATGATDFRVRKAAVRDALLFLTSPQRSPNRPPGCHYVRNPAYADVQIDWAVLDNLPEDDIPGEFVMNPEEEAAHSFQNADAPTIEPGPASDQECPHGGLVHLGINSNVVSDSPTETVFLSMARAISGAAGLAVAPPVDAVLDIHYSQVASEIARNDGISGTA